MAINVTASTIDILTWQGGNLSSTPAAARNTALDTVNSCATVDGNGIPRGIPLITVTQLGTWLNICISASPIELTISQLGTPVVGILLSTTTASIVTLTIDVRTPDIAVAATRLNWVKWSNIGSLDFTVWKDNIAGERPLDWPGWVYALKKLGGKVVAYGENGVSYLVPSSISYGLQTIHRVGLKGKGAVCGDDLEQFFIDESGKLYKLGDLLELLDYSEYLDPLLSSVIMSYDYQEKLIYICDGIVGFIYSIKEKSLTSGPINITGIGRKSGTLYVGASSVISTPLFEICTDIYDMGSRKPKTIASLEIGVDSSIDLWTTIDYRKDNSAAFRTLNWHKVNPSGITVIPCYGIEFRFRLKAITYSYFELDYFKINGTIHNYSYLDSLSKNRSAVSI